jgi:uracil-DNA glycosylase
MGFCRFSRVFSDQYGSIQVKSGKLRRFKVLCVCFYSVRNINHQVPRPAATACCQLLSVSVMLLLQCPVIVPLGERNEAAD